MHHDLSCVSLTCPPSRRTLFMKAVAVLGNVCLVTRETWGNQALSQLVLRSY